MRKHSIYLSLSLCLGLIATDAYGRLFQRPGPIQRLRQNRQARWSQPVQKSPPSASKKSASGDKKASSHSFGAGTVPAGGGLYSANNREEAPGLAETQKRVCDLERKLEKLGVKSYSQYGVSNFDPPDTWVAKEKILSNLVNYLENGHQEKAAIIDHLDVTPGFVGVSGPEKGGNIYIGETTPWSEIQAKLDAMSDLQTFEKQNLEHDNLAYSLASKHGLRVPNGTMLMGSAPSLEKELAAMKRLEAVLAKFNIGPTQLQGAMFFVPGENLPAESKFGGGGLSMPVDFTEEQMLEALKKVPLYEGLEAIAELKKFRDLATTKIAKQAMDNEIQTQEQQSPIASRQRNKESVEQMKKQTEQKQAREGEISAFQEQMDKVAAKLGPDFVFMDEYGATEGSKKILAIVSKLADQGYKLKKASRTIAMTSAWGAPTTQSEGVTGDCRTWTAISEAATEAQILSLFEKK